MITPVRRIFVLVALLSSFSFSIFQNAHATSAQDTWYVPSESGWGMNVIQQGASFGFAIYVYDQNRNPVWYLGSGTGNLGTGWTGQMYSYTGPFFQAPTFDSAMVSSTPVGTFSFVLDSVQSASLTYSIGGVVVRKSLARLAIANDDMSGNYIGARVQRIYNCTNPALNQASAEGATFAVTHSSGNVSISAQFSNNSCTYAGSYTQLGRYGNVNGSFTCTTGSSGTFNMFEIESTSQAMTGRFTASVFFSGSNCLQEGRMGGVSLLGGSF